MEKKDTKKPKSNEETIRKALYSYDEDTIIKTLEFIREKGNSKVLPDIIKIYKAYKNSKLGEKIYDVLADLKFSEAASIIVDAIDDKELYSIRKDLLALTWMTRIDFSKYFDKFVDWFLQFDLSDAFEAFTAIEYMHIYTDSSVIEKTITRLKESLSDIDENKKELLVDLVHLLEQKIKDEQMTQEE